MWDGAHALRLHRLAGRMPRVALTDAGRRQAAGLGLALDRLHRLSIDLARVSTLVVFDRDVRVDGVNR